MKKSASGSQIGQPKPDPDQQERDIQAMLQMLKMTDPNAIKTDNMQALAAGLAEELKVDQSKQEQVHSVNDTIDQMETGLVMIDAQMQELQGIIQVKEKKEGEPSEEGMVLGQIMAFHGDLLSDVDSLKNGIQQQNTQIKSKMDSNADLKLEVASFFGKPQALVESMNTPG